VTRPESTKCRLRPKPCPRISARFEDVMRILAEHDLPTGRGGLLIWSWIGLYRFCGAWSVISFLSGEWNGLGRTVGVAHRQGNFEAVTGQLSPARRHLTPELDEDWLGPLVESLAFATLRFAPSLAFAYNVLPGVDAEHASRLSPAQRASCSTTSRLPTRSLNRISCYPSWISAQGSERSMHSREHLVSRPCCVSLRRWAGSDRLAMRSLLVLESRIAERGIDRG